MKMKYRTVYHMKCITEINTLPCLHANEVQNIVSHEKQGINTLQCLTENEVQKVVSHEKHEREINTMYL